MTICSTFESSAELDTGMLLPLKVLMSSVKNQELLLAVHNLPLITPTFTVNRKSFQNALLFQTKNAGAQQIGDLCKGLCKKFPAKLGEWSSIIAD